MTTTHQINDGGPAEDMSLRDWFAGQALAGLCANENWHNIPTQQLVKLTYEHADAMLAARNNQPTTT